MDTAGFVKALRAKGVSQRHLVDRPGHDGVIGVRFLPFTQGLVTETGSRSPVGQAQRKEQEGDRPSTGLMELPCYGEDRPKIIKRKWVEQMSVEKESEEVGSSGDRR